MRHPVLSHTLSRGGKSRLFKQKPENRDDDTGSKVGWGIPLEMSLFRANKDVSPVLGVTLCTGVPIVTQT